MPSTIHLHIFKAEIIGDILRGLPLNLLGDIHIHLGEDLQPDILRQILAEESKILSAIDDLKAAFSTEAKSISDVSTAVTNLANRLTTASNTGDDDEVEAVAQELTKQAASLETVATNINGLAVAAPTVGAPTLASIAISPSTVSLAPSGTQVFTITGTGSDGNPYTLEDSELAATDSEGPLTVSGGQISYEAPGTVGSDTISVTATVGSATASAMASVTIS
jgi:hypothetical protein